MRPKKNHAAKSFEDITLADMKRLAEARLKSPPSASMKKQEEEFLARVLRTN